MINLTRKTLIRLLKSVVMGLIIGFVLCLPGTLTYADLKTHSPNVVVTVDKKGQISCDGNMFDNSLWYPGKKVDGTIRINNQFTKILVTDLAVQMNLLKWKSGYSRDMVEDSFLQNMELSLNMKNNLFQNQFSLNHQRLYKFLSRVEDKRYQGYHLQNKEQFYIEKGDFVDVDYSLEMDQESGNELQELTANVGLLITVSEK